MNRLNILPADIHEYIFFIRDQRLVILIQKKWRKYHAPKIVAADLLASCYSSRPGIYASVLVMEPHTAGVMEYIVKVLSGKEDRTIWNTFLEDIEYALFEDQFSGGPWAQYYNRTDAAFETLKDKFRD